MTTSRLASLLVLATASAASVGCLGRGRAGEQPAEQDDADVNPSQVETPEASAPEAAPPPDAGAPTPEASLLGDAAAPPPVDCPPGAELVYVASEERALYAFDPTTAKFSPRGSIDCAGGSYVNSMAVDRTGTAWINYGDGSVWKVSTYDPRCTPTGYLPNQHGVAMFGMGFSAKSAGSTQDTLFVDDLGGSGLGYIDLSTMDLGLFGPFAGSLAGRDCELTGTADARLFGFFAGSPYADAAAAAVVALDPASEAATQEWPLPTIDTGSDWAFSFWGGDFYLYTADKYDSNSPDTTVTRFRPSDGSLTVVAQNIGFRVVGAGVSTCAPIAPVQ